MNQRCPGAPLEVDSERGFTLIEMIVAISLIGLIMTFTAQMFYGGLSALSAARQRSTFLEIGNGAIESVRALPYDAVGVRTNDPDYTVLYTAGTPRRHEGRDAVAIGDTDFTPTIRSLVPKAVSVVSSSEVPGLPLPYTVRRWVTWDTVSGGPARAFKRLQVQVEWSENRISTRRISLTSVVYPGGIGPAGSTNQPPTVSFVQSPTSCVQAGTTTVNFDATGSDPEGGALSYTWSFGDSTQAFTEDASKTYSLGGTYNVSVEAKDAQGATGAASGTVTVSSGTNALPTINPAVSPSSGTAPLAVVANANAVDPEGDPLTYRWEWGDGSPDATTASAGKTYQTPGTYTVKLTVTENGCRTVTWTGTVTAVPLQCAILSGSHFLNPTTNTTKNEILVRSDNEVPANRKDIRFVVYTNAACSGAKVQLPISGGVFTATLTDFAEANGVRTWTVDTSLNKVVFVRGDNQQATVYAPAASPTVTAYHSFNVRLTS